jgi:hypothetical protein
MKAFRTLTFLLVILLNACNASTPPRFGIAWNAQRQERGIRLVPPAAELRNPGDPAGEHWLLRGQSPNAPRWGGKEIEVIDGKIAREADVFYGPRYDDPVDGSQESVLRVRFDYKKEAEGNSPWKITLKNGAAPAGRELSITEAKEILGTWGLQY